MLGYMSVYGKKLTWSRRGSSDFFHYHISYRAYVFSFIILNQQKKHCFKPLPHESTCFSSFNESAFRPYETSESTHQNRFFLKPLSEVGKKTRTQLSGLKNTRFKKFLDLCGRGLKS